MPQIDPVMVAPLLPREPRFAKTAKESKVRRGFHAKQRERVAEPIPKQDRTVTLERRRARKAV